MENFAALQKYVISTFDELREAALCLALWVCVFQIIQFVLKYFLLLFNTIYLFLNLILLHLKHMVSSCVLHTHWSVRLVCCSEFSLSHTQAFHIHTFDVPYLTTIFQYWRHNWHCHCQSEMHFIISFAYFNYTAMEGENTVSDVSMNVCSVVLLLMDRITAQICVYSWVCVYVCVDDVCAEVVS